MILVVGATGDLGSQITERLLARGEQVRVLLRPGPGAVGRSPAPAAQTVLGDLTDPASLAAACAGVDVVVTTASASSRGAPDTLETVDLQGTVDLVEAAETAGVRRFVLVSALGADPEHPSPLLRAKGRAEQRLRASGMAWTILQPDVFMDRLFPLVVGGPALAGLPVTLVGTGGRRHSFVASRDVAGYAVAAVDGRGPERHTVLVGGPDPLTWHDVVAAFERELGRDVEVRTVEPGGDVPGLPDFVVGLLAALDGYDSALDISEASRTYGVEPTPVSEVVGALVGTRFTAPGSLGPVTSTL
jgi:NADH dehydrogenase